MVKAVSFCMFKKYLEDDLDDDKKGSTLKQIDSSEDTFEDGNFKNRVV
jgi:hypothetical protein